MGPAIAESWKTVLFHMLGFGSTSLGTSVVKRAETAGIVKALPVAAIKSNT